MVRWSAGVCKYSTLGELVCGTAGVMCGGVVPCYRCSGVMSGLFVLRGVLMCL